MGVTAGARRLARSRLRVRGKALKRIDAVVFEGAAGRRRRRRRRRRVRATTKYVDVRVPRAAVTGPGDARRPPTAPTSAPTAVAADASTRRRSRRRVRQRRSAVDVEVAGQPRLLRRRAPGAASPTSCATPRPSTVAVELVRALRRRRDRALGAGGGRARACRRRSAGTAPPAARSSSDGRYAFRVCATRPSGATASSAQAPAPGAPAKAVPGSFLFQRDIFPIRGPHTSAPAPPRSAAAARPPGPGRRSPSCGTPLVAARGGTVQVQAATSRRAGNYLVIDGDEHRRRLRLHAPARARRWSTQGDHVCTGQPIGFVGDTGDADGCHLHFEVWTAPGLVLAAARPIDPLPLAEGLGHDVVTRRAAGCRRSSPRVGIAASS